VTRVLITGASGFLGGWLAQACASRGDYVVGASRRGTLDEHLGAGVALDLNDLPALTRLLSELEPSVIFHLAALSHVGRSWREPGQTLHNNVCGAVSLLEAARVAVPRARIVWASSGEVYGAGAPLPTTEDAPLSPGSPYAVSKAAGDMLAGVYADAHGLDIVLARTFAVGGPGQLPIFLLSSVARQAAQARREGAETVRITTGNPDIRRDLTDVRDVVRAYLLLADPQVRSGVYNVCSGVSSSTAERVAAVAELVAPLSVEHVVDAALVRDHETPEIRGSYARLEAATGWRPQIPLRQTAGDTLAWWERELVP